MANVIDSFNYDESTYVFTLPYGSCSTNPTQKNKEVEVPNFSLETGARVAVKFTTTNTASSPTLNVSGTGAKQICYNGAEIAAEFLAEGKVYEFVYDGTQWDLLGDPTPEDTNEDFSKVGWSQIIKDGIQIASITIDGISTEVYAPTSDGNTGDGNTQYSTHVGEADTLSNDAVASGPYLKLVADNETIKTKHQIKGEGATIVSSDANGNIKIYTPLETELSKEVTGTGNAVTDISVSDHKITLTKGATFLTGHPGIPTSSDSTSAVSPAHGGTFTAVDSVDRDNNGHVTKINTKTVTLPTVTFEHPDIEMSTNTTSTAAPAHGGTFTAIDSITKDSDGHVTKFNTKTVTLPAAEHPSITTTTDTTSTDSPSYNGDFTAVDSVTRDNNGHVKKINTKAVSLKKAFDDFEDKISENLESESNELVIADDNTYKIFQVSVDGLATTDITAQNITAQNINGFGWTQHCTSGVKIATVTMNNVTKDVYAPAGDGTVVQTDLIRTEYDMAANNGAGYDKIYMSSYDRLNLSDATSLFDSYFVDAENSKDFVYVSTDGIGTYRINERTGGKITDYSQSYMAGGNLYSNNAEITGGTIGGFTLKDGKLYTGTKNGLAWTTVGGTYIGTDGISIGHYLVDSGKTDSNGNTIYYCPGVKIEASTGKLTANNAEITGGTIAGWNIDGTTINGKNVNNSTHETYSLTLNSNPATSGNWIEAVFDSEMDGIETRFAVSGEGKLSTIGMTANDATISSSTISNSTITGGTIAGINISNYGLSNNINSLMGDWCLGPYQDTVGYDSLDVDSTYNFINGGSGTSPIVMFAGNNNKTINGSATADAGTNTEKLNFYVTQSGFVNAQSILCDEIGLKNGFSHTIIDSSGIVIRNGGEYSTEEAARWNGTRLTISPEKIQWVAYDGIFSNSIDFSNKNYMYLSGAFRAGGNLCLRISTTSPWDSNTAVIPSAVIQYDEDFIDAYVDVADAINYLFAILKENNIHAPY